MNTPHEVADRAWGLAEPVPAPWAAGEWSFERRGDEIADVRHAGRLVLRMVRLVARDRDWNTVPAEVRDVDADGSALRVRLALEGFGAALDADLVVRAEADVLVFETEVRSRSGFWRNRIGLVVLHPPEVSGERLEVVATDGDGTVTSFPTQVAPHQPARDVARMRWTHDGVASELAFSGDVFEMEDQRNWTDASFKTYSTPLDLPFPVLVREGETVRQSVRLASRVVAEAAPAPGPMRVQSARARVPKIQVGASTAAERHLRPAPDAAALLVELDLRGRRWPAALARAAREAGRRPLDVRLVAAGTEEVEEAVIAALKHSVTRIGVFDATSHMTEPELWEALTTALTRHGAQIPRVGGARTHFTELNREHHRLPADLPALSFSITPQMHARERSQLVESLAMQRVVAENAVRIAGGRPVDVGPVTLRPRLNAVATSAQAEPPGDDVTDGYGPGLLPTATDPRQAGPALAAWTVASAAALCVPGVAAVTYFETSGPRGLGDVDGEYPVAEAVRLLHGLAGAPLVDAPLDPHGVAALAAEVDGTVHVLAANVTPEHRSIGTPLGAVDLAPYAVVHQA
ncbi:hypothetical protein GCM10023169_26340 [Georgenia halophila]|uniref:Uncharacterized protein n=1 Tax=Georgenia halophila TaxID=620889 RepID=A0ABP8LCA7_9MICO